MPCGGDWGSGGYNDCTYERRVANRATRVACELIKLIRIGGEPLNCELTDATRKWIRKHDKEDRKRIAREKENKARIAKRKKVLAKLTKKERALLNLTDEE